MIGQRLVMSTSPRTNENKSSVSRFSEVWNLLYLLLFRRDGDKGFILIEKKLLLW